MKNLTPLVKGIITGTVMMLTAIVLPYTKVSPESGWGYLIYAVYAAGIVWTLFDYARSAEYKSTFGAIFSQGFRCFIIVTLIMVVFAIIYSKQHPEYKEQYAKSYREELVKRKSRTPAQMDEEVANARKGYTTQIISGAIFGYLVIGVFFTAAGAGLLLIRRK